MEFIRDIEFYNTPEGDVMMKRLGEPIKVLDQGDRDFISAMLTILSDHYSASLHRLEDVYSKSATNKIFFEFQIVRRFIKCNFGEYDQYKMDVDRSGKFNFEEVRCPLRGECRDECVVCKPKLDTRITEREMDVFRRIVEGKEAFTIADELFISPATVNRHRENIKAKIKVNTIGQMVKYWKENDLK